MHKYSHIKNLKDLDNEVKILDIQIALKEKEIQRSYSLLKEAYNPINMVSSVFKNVSKFLSLRRLATNAISLVKSAYSKIHNKAAASKSNPTIPS